MSRKFALLFCMLLLATFSSALFAQQPKKTGASISGVVLDAAGKPVANAGVSCETSGGRTPHAMHTDAKGKFSITGLKPDSYDIKASAHGYSSVWQRNIPIKKGQAKEITLRLVNDNDDRVVVMPTPKAEE